LAPFTPGVPPGGEASWAIGGQQKRTEQRRKGVRCGISRAVCVYRKSTRIRSDFHLSALPRLMANCTYALTVLLRLLAGCVHRHPTSRGTFGGRRQRNKQNGYCAQGPARSLLGLCSLGLQP